MSKIISAICGEAWAIETPMLQTIIEIAERSYNSVNHDEVKNIIDRRELALQKIGGQRVNGTRYATARDGVAIIPIVGPIFHRANLFTDFSGAVSNEMLAQDINTVLTDQKIKAVLLDVDSPGGQVAGTSELSNLIYAGRQQKPIYSYISARGASGGYWLASSAEKINLDSTAIVGSIGVVMAVNSSKSKDEIEFVSSNAPNKRVDANTPDGQKEIQKLVDSLEERFIASVSRNRNVSDEIVKSDFGNGGVFVGNEAVDRNMVDEVSSFEETLDELINLSHSNSKVFINTSIKQVNSRENEMEITLDLIKTQYSDIANALRKEGENAVESAADALIDEQAKKLKAEHKFELDAAVIAAIGEGAEMERNRIKGVFEHVNKRIAADHQEMMIGFMFDGKTTAADAAIALVDAQEAKKQEFGAKYHNDAPKPVTPVADNGKGISSETDQYTSIEDECKAKWESDAKVRNEFSSLSTFTHYTRAVRAGKVKVLGGQVTN